MTSNDHDFRGGTVTDTPTESTAAELRRHYRRQHPLLDTYLTVIEERNRDDRPITEPFDPPHGVSNREAARIALQRLGCPDDALSAAMAEAYVEKLEGEIRELAVDVPTLDDVVIEALFPAAGCLPTPGDWQGEDEGEKAAVAAEIVPRLTDDMLRDLVVTAMPAVLSRIIDRDHDRRALEDRVFEIGDRVRVLHDLPIPPLSGTILRQAADTDERLYRVKLDQGNTFAVREDELESEDDRGGTADHGQGEESTRGWAPQLSLDDPLSEAAYSRLLDKAVEKFGLGYHFDGENDMRKAMDYALDAVGRGFAAAALNHAMTALPGITEEQVDMLSRVAARLDLETVEILDGANGEGMRDGTADCLVDARSKPCPQCIPCPAHEPTSRSS